MRADKATMNLYVPVIMKVTESTISSLGGYPYDFAPVSYVSVFEEIQTGSKHALLLVWELMLPSAFFFCRGAFGFFFSRAFLGQSNAASPQAHNS